MLCPVVFLLSSLRDETLAGLLRPAGQDAMVMEQARYEE